MLQDCVLRTGVYVALRDGYDPVRVGVEGFCWLVELRLVAGNADVTGSYVARQLVVTLMFVLSGLRSTVGEASKTSSG